LWWTLAKKGRLAQAVSYSRKPGFSIKAPITSPESRLTVPLSALSIGQ
jgi:hypothetical protein